MFNKFTLSSRERLDSFKDIIGVLQISGETTGVAVEELFPTVLDEDKSCSDSALIPVRCLPKWIFKGYLR